MRARASSETPSSALLSLRARALAQAPRGLALLSVLTRYLVGVVFVASGWSTLWSDPPERSAMAVAFVEVLVAPCCSSAWRHARRRFR